MAFPHLLRHREARQQPLEEVPATDQRQAPGQQTFGGAWGVELKRLGKLWETHGRHRTNDGKTIEHIRKMVGIPLKE